MAYCPKTMLASLTLILFLATPQSSHGLVISGINILQIRVSGTLYCSVTGNPDPACGFLFCPRVTGAALVTISCDGGRTSLAEVFTDITGSFDAAISVVGGLLFDESSCAAYVRLPVPRCAVLPSTGSLRSGVRLVGVAPIGLAGGLARYTAEVFQLLRGV